MVVLLKGRVALFFVALALVFSGLVPSSSEALQGGPDALVYRYIDSNSVGGPRYVWEDIKKTGTDYNGTDNYLNQYDKLDKDLSNGMGSPIKIGFNFNFYGNTYSHVYLAGNGYIVFSSNDYSNCTFDGSSEVFSKSDPNNLIAPFWGWNDTFF